MTLDEQLAMAVNATPTAAPAQPAPVAPVAPTIVNTVPTTEVPTTVTQTVQPTVQPIIEASQTIQTLDLNQATAEVQNQNYGVQEISLGTVISTRPIDPVRKMDKGEKFRFTLISNKIGSCKIHNHPTLNKIACFSTETHYGKCCQDLDEPKLRYYMPVLVYSTMPGNVNQALPQGKSELRLLVIWDLGAYNQLCEEIVNAGNNWQVDFVATSEDTYGKLSFRAQSTSFRQMPEYAQAIKDAEVKWESIKDKAPMVVRRNMDEEKYIKMTANAPVPTLQQYQAQDVLDVSNL